MGKYMNPCGKIESFRKRETWVYLLWENVFLNVKTLNPLYGNRQSAGKVLGI